MRLYCLSLLNSLSTMLRSLYNSLSNRPRCRSLLLRGIVMPTPRLRKKVRILRLLYPLSATIRPGSRLGLPRPLRLIAPCSSNCSNTVASCCSPGVSTNVIGLPLPSQRTCILVDNPPLLLPNACSEGSGGFVGSPFLPQQRAGEHARWSYLRTGLSILSPHHHEHLSEAQPVSCPRCRLYASDRSERLHSARGHSVQASLARKHRSYLSTGCH
jgi:hypothetical protein